MSTTDTDLLIVGAGPFGVAAAAYAACEAREDGARVDADYVIFATGYRVDMRPCRFSTPETC